MKKLVRESISYDRHRMSVEDFVEWYEATEENNPDVDWDWIKSILMNDEDSTNEELEDLFLEEDRGMYASLVADLINKRDYFLDFRYAQEI